MCKTKMYNYFNWKQRTEFNTEIQDQDLIHISWEH
jgi:hypothetical protein